MVPEGWKVASLGEVCDGNLKTGPFGSQLHAHEYVEDGVPVIMPKDLIGCRVNIKTAAKITKERSNVLKKHILEIGDLIFSRRGDVTRFALIDEVSSQSLCGTGCLRARPSNKHSSVFLSYFLQKNSVKKWLEQNAVGQTMPNMNTAILFELPLVSASSKAEEDKIAKILSTWDQAIEVTEKLIANSQQQKKSLMQQLLTGKKRLTGFSGEWKRIRLGDVADLSSGGTPKSTVPEYYDGEILWVSIADMTSHGKWITSTARNITDLGLENSAARIYPVNTILYAMYASIGECSIASKELASSQAILGIRPKECLDYLFLYYYLSSIKEKIKLQGQQGAQSNLNAGMVKAFHFRIPSLDEQKKIANVLSTADKEIQTLQKKLDFLKLEKKALMQQLLTGKRRVKIDKEGVSQKEIVDA